MTKRAYNGLLVKETCLSNVFKMTFQSVYGKTFLETTRFCSEDNQALVHWLMKKTLKPKPSGLAIC